MPEDPRADSPCPELAELILASEGEVPKRRQRELSDHIRSCPTCRADLGNAGRALSEYQDAHETPELRAAEATAAADRMAEFRLRLHDEQRTTAANASPFSFRSWLPVAAAVPVLVAALFISTRYSAVVRAEELITRAVAQEESVPVGTVRRVEIRVTPTRSGTPTGGHHQAWSMTRELGLTRPAMTSASANPDHDALVALLEANHLEWQDPLSVRAFRTWRDSLPHKTDSVTFPDPDTLALQTTTADGLLRSAVLIVRRVDFQPIKQMLNFEGFGQVEIVELSRWVATSPSLAERSVTPSPAGPIAAPSADTLDEAELDVRRALHDVNADLNPTIAVGRSARAIEVRGRVNPRRRAEITRALNKLEPVRVMLQGTERSTTSSSETAERGLVRGTTATPATDVESTGAWATDSPHASNADAARLPVDFGTQSLQQWLDRTFGPGERAAMFLPTLADEFEHVQRRAEAFSALAVRYPESATSQLSRSARDKLDALVDAQYRDLMKAVQALDDHLALFLGTTTRPAVDTSTPRPWQPCAAAMVSSVQRLRLAVVDVLQQRDLPLPTEIAPGREEPSSLSNLRRAVDALWQQSRVAASRHG